MSWHCVAALIVTLAVTTSLAQQCSVDVPLVSNSLSDIDLMTSSPTSAGVLIGKIGTAVYSIAVSSSGVSSPLLMAGSSSGATGMTDGTGAAASFTSINSMAYETRADGDRVYVFDGPVLRIVSARERPSTVTTWIGSTARPGIVDGSPSVVGFATDSRLTLYPARSTLLVFARNCIREVNSSGYATTLAGGCGQSGSVLGSFVVARFEGIRAVATRGTDIYVADANGLKLLSLDTVHRIELGVEPVLLISGIAFVGDTLYMVSSSSCQLRMLMTGTLEVKGSVLNTSSTCNPSRVVVSGTAVYLTQASTDNPLLSLGENCTPATLPTLGIAVRISPTSAPNPPPGSGPPPTPEPTPVQQQILEEPPKVVEIAIIIIAVVAVIMFVLGGVACFTYMKRREKKEKYREKRLEMELRRHQAEVARAQLLYGSPSDPPSNLSGTVNSATYRPNSSHVMSSEIVDRQQSSKSDNNQEELSEDKDVRTGQLAMAGRYNKVKLIGRGSAGSVFSILLEDGSTIAMKEILINQIDMESQMSDLQKEMKVISTVKHPSVVRYFGAAIDRKELKLYLFMELVPGGSLGALVRGMDEPLPERTLKQYIYQVLDGLAFIHQMGIVHRDVKGDNILLTTDGRVKLADFGTARAIGVGTAAGKAASTVIGTPYFMAPEVLAPAVDDVEGEGYGSKADVWSLGITVAELLNRGTAPWPTFTNPGQAFIWISGPKGIPQIPPCSDECADFISKCCTRDVSQRPTAAEMLNHPWLPERYPSTTNRPKSPSRRGGGPAFDSSLRSDKERLVDSAKASRAAALSQANGLAPKTPTTPNESAATAKPAASAPPAATVTVSNGIHGDVNDPTVSPKRVVRRASPQPVPEEPMPHPVIPPEGSAERTSSGVSPSYSPQDGHLKDEGTEVYVSFSHVDPGEGSEAEN